MDNPVSTTQARMLYDDDEIRVIWHQGASEFALVTFGDLLTPADGLRFFAERPVRNLNLTAASVLVKRANWYPKASLLGAYPALAAHLSPYKTRIIYGASMGGYGCIKHSALLGATTVIALCPQWSVDPAECDGNNPGWPQLFSPMLTGHGTRRHEVAGDLYIFADLHDEVDRYQAYALKEIYPSATIINVPMVAHHVTPVFAGTQNLKNLIEYCRARDVPALRKLSRALRKDSVRRPQTIADVAIKRHPKLVYEVLAARPQEDMATTELAARHLFPAIGHLAARRGPGQAARYIQAYRHELRDPRDILLAGSMLAAFTGRLARWKTFHGTFLAYDTAERRALHAADPLPAHQLPLRWQAAGGRLTFFIEAGGARLELGVDGDGYLSDGYPAASFLMEPFIKGTVKLSHDGWFLSGEPEGRLIRNRDAAYEWESFRLE